MKTKTLLIGTAVVGGLYLLLSGESSAAPGPFVSKGDLVGAPFTAVSGTAGNGQVSLPFEPDTTMLVFQVTDTSNSAFVKGDLVGYSVAGQKMLALQFPKPMSFKVPREQLVKWVEAV
jgi:hypothetical protein